MGNYTTDHVIRVKSMSLYSKLSCTFCFIIQVFIGHSDHIQQVAFTPDYLGLVSVGEAILLWDFHGRGKHFHINGYVNNNLLDYKNHVLKRKLFGRTYLLKVIWVLRKMFISQVILTFTGWCRKFTLVIGPIKCQSQ